MIVNPKAVKESALIIGMPAGSLANPTRGGNLIKLLENSGFNVSGYDAGGPSKFNSIGFLMGWDGRPQEFGAQLGLNEIDVAIAGDDWIAERQHELRYEYKTKVQLEKVLSLRRGEVKIVAVVNESVQAHTIQEFVKSLAKNDIITIASEMPFMTLHWMQELLKEAGLSEKFSHYSVQKYKTPPKIKQGILVYETWGKTESKVKNLGVDLGIEITQSGSALRNYGLKILDTLMKSETGIWINSEIKKDKTKRGLLELFLLNLYGSVNAENKVMILFNVANIYKKEIENYLKHNYLFADEPTMNIGKSFTEFSVQVEVNDQNNPLAKIRYELAKRKAVSINTVPLISSIPSLDILDF